MDVSTFNLLVNGMKRLEASEHLMAMDWSIYAHISDKDRKKQHKKWYKDAYPEAFEEKVVKTSDLELF
jgi:hypothetical protein